MSLRLSQHPAYPAQHVGLRLPFVHSAAPLCVPLCVGTVDSVAHCHSRSQLLYPRGPRSGLGSIVPAHQRLIDLIRPTRRHIPISPLGGLYVSVRRIQITVCGFLPAILLMAGARRYSCSPWSFTWTFTRSGKSSARPLARFVNVSASRTPWTT